MGKRLGLGLVKGLLIGAAFGLAITFGLRWPTPSGGLLAYLFALGASGTTGICAGKAPWKENAWFEAMLKGGVGVIAAAILYWLASSYAGFAIPWPGEEAHVPWTSIPLLYLAVVSGIYGALVELDHDETEQKSTKAKPAATAPAKARLALEDDEPAAETKAARKRI